MCVTARFSWQLFSRASFVAAYFPLSRTASTHPSEQWAILALSIDNCRAYGRRSRALKNNSGQAAWRCSNAACRRGSLRVACTMVQRRLDAIMAPRARALLASAMCCMCYCPMGCSIPSGVPEAAGGREDRPRGHERATRSWARFGRGRWRHLVDARAAPPRR